MAPHEADDAPTFALTSATLLRSAIVELPEGTFQLSVVEGPDTGRDVRVDDCPDLLC